MAITSVFGTTRTKPMELDAYSAYDYKPMFRDRQVGQAPNWVDRANKRRLEAYILLSAFLENSAHNYLLNDQDPDSRREYGDPRLIVANLVDAVIGEDATVSVRGARRESDVDKDEYADALQDFFDRWIDNELLLLTIMEVEEKAVGLGDGVYEVAWDANKGRAVVRCYDPGFYFPVIDPSTYDYGYPLKVHLAWEYEKFTGSENDTPERFVRRITYELAPYEELGVAPVTHPWSDKPATHTCLKSDGTWSFENTGSKVYLDLDPGRAVWAVNAEGEQVRDLDLGIDFLPIIHLPNTISRAEHFGRSALHDVMQILDDVQSTDTDLLKSSRTTGSPPLGTESPVTTDSEGKVTTYGPGQLIQGKVTVIDTSKNLDSLLKYIETLLKRLSTNIRMPESVLGKLRPSEVPSGIALALSFGPLRSLVRRMRLARSEKYPLLLKFVHRFHMLDDPSLRPPAGRLVDEGIPVVELAFGQFLPSDRAVIINDIVTLFRERIISRHTAIRLLMEEAGMGIRDASDELEQFKTGDFEGARTLGEAVESPDTAAEYLGIEIAEVDQTRIDQQERETEAAVAQAAARGFGGGGNPDDNGGGNKPPLRKPAAKTDK